MTREQLIGLSLYYKGEYFEIQKALKERKTVDLHEEVNAITILDSTYPEKLFDLKYPPYVLFYKGDISLLNKECVSVVGSRNPCDYALKATEGLCQKMDKVVVSGLAKGIDACAHLNSRDTIGILGCGIDYIYPYANLKLIKDIEKRGLIISEYPHLSEPLNYHFPFRNRIIAALSDCMYIMQCKDKSGTMTSVNEALSLGKEIRVLPYDIFDDNGVQNNLLIYEGATPIRKEEIAF
ncbi:MAG: DNA-processing protein DprA [Erysipelotrichaceae bacterium]|nr:DNA-processing protein DprA [Erysipelotrichaceae bacterium]